MPAADNFLLEPVPHEEVARWIAGKPLVSREVFNELLPELKARAFLISGLEDANVASEVRELIAELPRGAEEGSLIRAVRDDNGKLLRDPIHPWNVANPDMIGVPQSLRIDPAQLKARYDAETWAEFETRAKSTEILPGQTVWSWLHGKKLKKAA